MFEYQKQSNIIKSGKGKYTVHSNDFEDRKWDDFLTASENVEEYVNKFLEQQIHLLVEEIQIKNGNSQ